MLERLNTPSFVHSQRHLYNEKMLNRQAHNALDRGWRRDNGLGGMRHAVRKRVARPLLDADQDQAGSGLPPHAPARLSAGCTPTLLHVVFDLAD